MADNSTLNNRLIPTVQYAAPTTGQTITASSSANVFLMINPAGTLLALTLALPASPSDGDKLTFGSSQAVTGFTMSGGTIIGPLTTMAVATFASYVFSATSGSWFRMG